MKKILLLALSFSLIGCSATEDNKIPTGDYCDHSYIMENRPEKYESCTAPKELSFFCTKCGDTKTIIDSANIKNHNIIFSNRYNYLTKSYELEFNCGDCYFGTGYLIKEDKNIERIIDLENNTETINLLFMNDGFMHEGLSTIQYNDFGEKISENIRYLKDDNQNYVDFCTTSFSYDLNHNLLSKESSIFLYDSTEFVYNFYSAFEQKPEENTTVETTYFKNRNGELEPCYRVSHKEDNENNKIIEIFSSYNKNINEWSNATTYEIQFDNENRVIFTDMRTNCSLDNYAGESLTVGYSEYNGEMLILEKCNYSCENGLYDGIKYIYEYRISEHPHYEECLKWNSETETWETYSKSIYELNEIGELTKYLCYKKSSDGTSWITGNKRIEEKNDSNNSTSYRDYYFSMKENDWVLYHKEYIELNDSGDESSFYNLIVCEPFGNKYGFCHEFDFDESGEVIRDFISMWSNEINNWVTYAKYEYKTLQDGTKVTEYYVWDDSKNDWRDCKIFNTFYEDSGCSVYESYYWSDEYNDFIGYDKFTEDGKSYIWNYDENDWAIYTKAEEFSNDKDGITQIFKIWSKQNQQYVNYEKIDYQNINGDDIQILYTWSKQVNDWLASEKGVYSKIDENTTSNETYLWSDKAQSWIGTEKSIITKSSVGNTFTEVTYDWSFEKNDWEKISKHTYYYVGDNQIETVDYFEWDEQTSDWKKVDKFVTFIDVITTDGGNMFSNEYYDWDSETNSWVGDRKITYLNEEDPFKTTVIKYAWSKETNSWQQSEKFVYIESRVSSHKILLGYYVWSNETNSWVSSDKYF